MKSIKKIHQIILWRSASKIMIIWGRDSWNSRNRMRGEVNIWTNNRGLMQGWLISSRRLSLYSLTRNNQSILHLRTWTCSTTKNKYATTNQTTLILSDRSTTLKWTSRIQKPLKNPNPNSSRPTTRPSPSNLPQTSKTSKTCKLPFKCTPTLS